MSNIEAGELHSKLSRPNYNLLLDSLNLLFKTTLKHSRLQTSVTSLVNCNKLMKLGFDQSVAFLQNKFRSFWTPLLFRYVIWTRRRFHRISHWNIVQFCRYNEKWWWKWWYSRAILSWYLGLVVNGCIVRDKSL